MGAWGTGPFDNDDAGDWANELEERGADAIREVFSEVADNGEDYVEGDLGSAVLAAAEVVARLHGRPGSDPVPEVVQHWIDEHRDLAADEGLITSARHAVDLVLGETSELLELWEEGGKSADWQAGVEDLRRRLDG